MAQRDTGALAATVGLGVVAGSGALLLAAGPRLVGHADYGSLAIAWTFSTVFGLGVATPTEQLINRQSNALGRHAPGRARAVLLLAAAVALLVGIALSVRTAHSGNGPWVAASCLLALLGWVACALLRGRVLAEGDLGGYAVSQVIEGGSRLCFVIAAIAVRDHALLLLLAAVGTPLLASAAWTSWRVRHLHPGRGHGDPPAQHLSFVLVALGYQCCLSGPVLLLGWRIGSVEPELVGAFVLASSVFRAPAVAAGGTFVGAMTSMSRAWGLGDAVRLSLLRRQTVLRVTVFTGVTTLAVCIAAPFVLPLLYGGSLRLSLLLYAALVVSTILAVVANAFAVALLATESGVQAALGWTLGALLTVVLLLVLPATAGWVASALVAGPLLTLVVLMAARPAGVSQPLPRS